MSMAYESSRDLSLIFASYAIAIFTSYATLRMSAIIAKSKEKSVRFSLLAAGSVAIGAGIWIIHLISMLAYSLPVAVSYELTIMLSSLLPSIFVGALSLHLLARPKPGILRVVIGGILIGGGISAMHFLSMAAISNTVSVSYEPFFFFVSIVIAITLAIFALFLNFQSPEKTADQQLNRLQWIGPLMLGLAFVAMHYIAMYATYFLPIDAESLTAPVEQSLPLLRLWVVCSLLLSMLFVVSKNNRLDRTQTPSSLEISNYREKEASLLKEKENLKLFSDEQALMVQKNEARLESIFNSLADGLIVINPAGKIEDVNPSALRLFGYTGDELLGMNVSKLMPKSRGFEHDGYIESYLKTGRIEIVGTGREVLCYHKDGSTFHAHLSVAEFTAGENKLFTGIIHDISDRVAAEEELKSAIQKADRASAAKSEFLANMSHEIRTPLNGVMGMLELMKTTSLDANQEKYLATAYDSSESLLSVISSILDFSQMESGSLSLQEIVFDVRKVIEDSVAQAAADISKKGLEFNCLVAENVPRTVIGDATHLEQIVFNLISNSVKFTDSGEITVRVSAGEILETKIEIFFEVEDTGIGIAKDKLTELFEPFTQEDYSSTRKYGGSGLGLAVTKHLIELMGGEISVATKRGKGTTFSFSLLLELAEPGEDSFTNNFQTDLRVMVVDDNKTNRDILSYYLSCWNIASSSVEDGKTAIDQLRGAAIDGTPYQIVLMDYLMPEMNGSELAEAIQADTQLSNTGIIMMQSITGLDEPIRPAGIQYTLAKPVRQLKLYDCLKQITSNSAVVVTENEADSHAQIAINPQFADKNVLIVDDMPTNLRVGVEMLRKLGLEADIATNGSEAIEALTNKEYDLVLMDCQMPIMDGYTATKEIRALEKAAGRKHRLPIVAVTAHALEGDREASLNAGMDDYLTKPLAFSELQSMLDRWLA